MAWRTKLRSTRSSSPGRRRCCGRPTCWFRTRAQAEDLLQTALTKAWFAWKGIKTNPEANRRRIMADDLGVVVAAAVDARDAHRRPSGTTLARRN